MAWLADLGSSAAFFLSPPAQTPPAWCQVSQLLLALVHLLFNFSYYVLTCEFTVVLLATQLQILSAKPVRCLLGLRNVWPSLVFGTLLLSSNLPLSRYERSVDSGISCKKTDSVQMQEKHIFILSKLSLIGFHSVTPTHSQMEHQLVPCMIQNVVLALATRQFT